MTTTLVALNTDAPSAVIPPPDTLDAYTRLVETLLRDVSKVKAAVLLCTCAAASRRCGRTSARRRRSTGGSSRSPSCRSASSCSSPVVGGPLCDLSLSLALACDVRLGTADASLKRGGAGEHVPLPAWSLASLALHVGVRRAQQLLWRRRDIGAHELLSCGMLHAPLGNTAAELLDAAASLPVPQSSPLDLLRRIVVQGFSISGGDQIGHSLAVSSLVIAGAVGRAAAACGEKPLPDLQPLSFKLTQQPDVWTLEMPCILDRVSLDELDNCMRALNKSLGKAANVGGPLPRCLVFRLVSSTADADSEYPDFGIPTQLMQLHSGEAWNMKLVKWLTKLEKTLTTLATLPLPTVAHLCGDGVIGPLALQIAFTCDVRVAQSAVSLDFGARSGVLPGTLTFRLAKHVGTGVAMSYMALDKPVPANEAYRNGAVQQVLEVFDPTLLSKAPHGAALLLCRYLLHDAVWTVSIPELQEKLLVWQRPPAASVMVELPSHMEASANSDEVPVSAEQLEQLAAFFPDQFILPTDAWQWKLSWSKALPENAPPSSPAGARPRPSREVLGNQMPLVINRVETLPTGWDAAPDLAPLCLELSGSIVTADAIASLQAHAMSAVKQFEKAATAGVFTGHRVMILAIKNDACSLQLPPELAREWAGCMLQLEASAVPVICAFDGLINGVGARAAPCMLASRRHHRVMRLTYWMAR